VIGFLAHSQADPETREGAFMTRAASRRGNTIITCENDVARGVRSLRRRCAVMRRVHKAAGDPPLRLREPGFRGLARIIVGQQLSVASAAAIWGRCAAKIQPITAAEMARLDDAALKACGLSAPKIRTLRAVARAVLDDGLDLERAGEMRDEALREQLIAIHGVGPWTADIFQMFCLGRADAFAPGDLALQVAAQHAFDLGERPSPADLEALADTWRPWRAVAARLLWAYYAVIKDGRSGIGV
jgi:DNA-3-methyladenine glycosylase II